MTETARFTDPWFSKPGFLYFLAAGDPPKAIKIGVTLASGFKNRLRSHQSSNHELLHVLGVIDFTGQEQGMRKAEELEQALHKRFAPHQRFHPFLVGCEWFNVHEDVLAFIAANCRPCADFDLPDRVAKPGPGMIF